MMDLYGQVVGGMWEGNVPAIGANQLVLEAGLPDLLTSLTCFFAFLWHNTFVICNITHIEGR